jgi:hypothetical protein
MANALTESDARIALAGAPMESLKKLHQMVESAIRTTAAATGLKFAQQGHGLWEDPVVEAGAATATPNNTVSGQMANMVKGANALMNAKKGQIVKAGGVAYKVTQAAKPTKHGMHIVTLAGASGGGKGDQYAMLVPPTSGNGGGGTIKLVNIGSANPRFRDLRPDLTVESEEGATPMASSRTDETQVWTSADLNEVAAIVQAVFAGDELNHHTEDQERDSVNIKLLRRAVRDGMAVRVEGTQVPVHRAAAVVQIYDGLSIENQQKLAAMSITRALRAAESITDESIDKPNEQ